METSDNLKKKVLTFSVTQEWPRIDTNRLSTHYVKAFFTNNRLIINRKMGEW